MTTERRRREIAEIQLAAAKRKLGALVLEGKIALPAERLGALVLEMAMDEEINSENEPELLPAS